MNQCNIISHKLRSDKSNGPLVPLLYNHILSTKKCRALELCLQMYQNQPVNSVKRKDSPKISVKMPV